MLDLGPVRRWKVGDILFAENNFILGAYVVTGDPSKIGSLDFHGPDQICVEYISAETAKAWSAVGQQAPPLPDAGKSP